MNPPGWRKRDYDVDGREIKPCCQDCGHVFATAEPLFAASDLEWYCLPCAREHQDFPVQRS